MIKKLKDIIENKFDIDMNTFIDKSKIMVKDIKTEINNINKLAKQELKDSTIKEYLYKDNNDSSYILAIPVSGCSKKDISITLDCGKLNIVSNNEKFKYDYSLFIDNDKIEKTKLKSGMLYLTILKKSTNIEL